MQSRSNTEIEIENLNYQIYRKIIRSLPIKFLANYVVPYRIVNNIGVNASEKSRNRNVKRYSSQENDEKIREKFRKVFRIEKEKRGFDILVCGHSHCRDFFVEDGVYSNNGYFPITKAFTCFKDGKVFQEEL